jgi:ketosteroid isomerase-like protein
MFDGRMGTYAKPKSLNRVIAQAFYEAYASRDAAKLAPFLDDDVRWTICGPVELLPYCGTRHGKAAVLDLIERLVPELFRITSFVPETLLVDGDRAATLNRLSGQRTEDGRVISYRVAQFLRFHDGKVVDYRSVIDSFDAAEQVLGHRIELAAGQKPVDDGGCIAI